MQATLLERAVVIRLLTLLKGSVGNSSKITAKGNCLIYCDKPKIALLVGIGKYDSITLLISLFLSLFWVGLVILKTNEQKYFHFEN